mmetsp:Transcript_50844/g.111330  ORF Transcript_50844/g.111330 Transcript_50844/m.111330 type:complete len:288 (-) Transcript_50844:1092-1955(-)
MEPNASILAASCKTAATRRCCKCVNRTEMTWYAFSSCRFLSSKHQCFKLPLCSFIRGRHVPSVDTASSQDKKGRAIRSTLGDVADGRVVERPIGLICVQNISLLQIYQFHGVVMGCCDGHAQIFRQIHSLDGLGVQRQHLAQCSAGSIPDAQFTTLVTRQNGGVSFAPQNLSGLARQLLAGLPYITEHAVVLPILSVREDRNAWRVTLTKALRACRNLWDCSIPVKLDVLHNPPAFGGARWHVILHTPQHDFHVSATGCEPAIVSRHTAAPDSPIVSFELSEPVSRR